MTNEPLRLKSLRSNINAAILATCATIAIIFVSIYYWDTDWFWCSKNVGAQHPLLRRLYGRHRLNSRTYQKIMRWNARHGLTRALDSLAAGTPSR